MADSFDDEGPPDNRSILYRIIEGLAVIAFVVAVFLWQSDGTLTAARALLADWGLGGKAAEPILVADSAPPQPAATTESQGAPGIDPVATGSVGREAAPSRVLTGEAPRDIALASGWQAACDDGTPRFCTASQSLSLSEDPAVETSWTIEKGKDGLVAIWTTPTGVQVNRGMSLVLGDGPAKTVPFDSCGPHSCEVRAKLAGDFTALLRKAGHARTQIVMRGGRTLTFEFSPDGLAAALDKLGV